MTHRVMLIVVSKHRVAAKQRTKIEPVRSRQSQVAASAGTRSTTMSTTQTGPQATTELPSLHQIGAQALDTVSALAEANQRVVGQLIELSASATADRFRMVGELQSAALDAAREVFTPT